MSKSEVDESFWQKCKIIWNSCINNWHNQGKNLVTYITHTNLCNSQGVMITFTVYFKNPIQRIFWYLEPSFDWGPQNSKTSVHHGWPFFGYDDLEKWFLIVPYDIFWTIQIWSMSIFGKADLFEYDSSLKNLMWCPISSWHLG